MENVNLIMEISEIIYNILEMVFNKILKIRNKIIKRLKYKKNYNYGEEYIVDYELSRMIYEEYLEYLKDENFPKESS